MEEEISKHDKLQASNRLAKIMGESILPNGDDLKLKSPSIRMDSSTSTPTTTTTTTVTPNSKTADKMSVDTESKEASASVDTNDPNKDNKNINTDDKTTVTITTENEKSNPENKNTGTGTDSDNKNNTSNIGNNTTTSNNEEKKSQEQNKDKKDMIAFPTTSKTLPSTGINNLSNSTIHNTMDDIFSRPIVQKVTKTKEGKKRIQPMHISNLPSLSPSVSVLTQSQFASDRYDFHQPEPRISQTTSTIPTNGFPILKRKHPGDDTAINVKKIFSKFDGGDDGGEEKPQQFILPTILPLPAIPTILAVPKIPKLIYYKIPHDENLLSTKVIECDNSKSKLIKKNILNIYKIHIKKKKRE